MSNELDQMFGDRLRRRLGAWNWTTRSPELTPLEFCLCTLTKSDIISNLVNSRYELIQRIRNEFESLDVGGNRKATKPGVHRCLL